MGSHQLVARCTILAAPTELVSFLPDSRHRTPFSAGDRLAGAWHVRIGFANPYPLAKLVSRHHITRSEFASCQR